jgi:hypothetical protein
MAHACQASDDRIIELGRTKPPGGEAPGEEAPGGEAPGGEAPGGEAPGGEAPDGEAPGEEAPGYITITRRFFAPAPRPEARRQAGKYP